MSISVHDVSKLLINRLRMYENDKEIIDGTVNATNLSGGRLGIVQ